MRPVYESCVLSPQERPYPSRSSPERGRASRRWVLGPARSEGCVSEASGALQEALQVQQHERPLLRSVTPHTWLGKKAASDGLEL